MFSLNKTQLDMLIQPKGQAKAKNSKKREEKLETRTRHDREIDKKTPNQANQGRVIGSRTMTMPRLLATSVSTTRGGIRHHSVGIDCRPSSPHVGISSFDLLKGRVCGGPRREEDEAKDAVFLARPGFWV